MPYTINNYDGSVLTVVNDGETKQISGITLTGKDSANYGEKMNENFVYLLQSFAGSDTPENPIYGQLWYDSANNRLNFYGNNDKWKLTTGLIISSITPGAGSIGDLWYNTSTKQLYVRDTLQWILVGPHSSDESRTSFSVDYVEDTNHVSHYILKTVVNDEVVFIISDSEFTLLNPIDNPNNNNAFSIIKKGITFLNLSNGVTASDHRFWGTSSNSDRLNGELADKYQLVDGYQTEPTGSNDTNPATTEFVQSTVGGIKQLIYSGVDSVLTKEDAGNGIFVFTNGLTPYNDIIDIIDPWVITIANDALPKSWVVYNKTTSSNNSSIYLKYNKNNVNSYVILPREKPCLVCFNSQELSIIDYVDQISYSTPVGSPYIFTDINDTSFTPSETKMYRIIVIGAGGAGGRYFTSSDPGQNAYATGGGAGGVAIIDALLVRNKEYTFSIGQGGPGGHDGLSAADGENTSFILNDYTTIIAYGGKGGESGDAEGTFAGGAGGIAENGVFNWQGGSGGAVGIANEDRGIRATGGGAININNFDISDISAGTAYCTNLGRVAISGGAGVGGSSGNAHNGLYEPIQLAEKQYVAYIAVSAGGGSNAPSNSRMVLNYNGTDYIYDYPIIGGAGDYCSSSLLLGGNIPLTGVGGSFILNITPHPLINTDYFEWISYPTNTCGGIGGGGSGSFNTLSAYVGVISFGGHGGFGAGGGGKIVFRTTSISDSAGNGGVGGGGGGMVVNIAPPLNDTVLYSSGSGGNGAVIIIG